MSHIFDWIFSQYDSVPLYIVVLEFIAVVFGVFSVVFSKNNNVLVYPTGIASTLIFVYILFVYGLLGDMIINVYYFLMSLYGWYVWTRKISATQYTPISTIQGKEKKQVVLLFVSSIIFITLVYFQFGNLNRVLFHEDNFAPVLDIITTGFFFAGMWLLAKRKIENWIYLIIGNIISIPLYIYKGLIFSAILYILLTTIAVFGFYAWKRILNNTRIPSL